MSMLDMKRKGKRFELICPECNKKFTTEKQNVIYCSYTCARKTAYKRQLKYLQRPEVKERRIEYQRVHRRRRRV
jgi:hypothetical protein